MVAYVVLASFTDQGVRNAKESPKRAEAFKDLAKTFGVTIREIVWTQGRYDIVTIVDAPDEASFMSLTLSLARLGNIRTESLRAFSAAEMTKIVDDMLLIAFRSAGSLTALAAISVAVIPGRCEASNPESRDEVR